MRLLVVGWVLVLMGRVRGKLPIAWETGHAVVGCWLVVGSHGQGEGKAANSLGNGRSGCWLLVRTGRENQQLTTCQLRPIAMGYPHHPWPMRTNNRRGASPDKPTTCQLRPMAMGYPHHPWPMRTNNHRGVSPDKPTTVGAQAPTIPRQSASQQCAWWVP